MTSDKLRRRILHEAARLMSTRRETEPARAKWRAARSICGGWIRQSDLPQEHEIRAELKRLEIRHEPDVDAADVDSSQLPGSRDSVSAHIAFFESLLAPLACVRQNRQRHPEGDVLYHSLQVFELGRQELPWDEEFLLAALLHDVGKGIDPRHHVNVGLNVLGDTITERTAWLIEHHITARGLLDGTIGVRARRRLVECEWFEELELLARCDRDGCVPGGTAPELHEALDYIRSIENEYV